MLRAGLWHRRDTFILNGDTPLPGVSGSLRLPAGPEGVRYLIKSFVYHYQPDGTVINRFHRVGYRLQDSGGPVIVLSGNPQANTAGQFVIVTAAEGVTSVTGIAGSSIHISLPRDMRLLRPGDYVNSEIANQQAGDQVSAVRCVVEEWLYEPAGERVPNIGSGDNRVDAINLSKLNDTLQKLADLLEAQSATP